ncbi:MAG: endopeptidase La [Desulfomonilaceae bacterium]
MKSSKLMGNFPSIVPILPLRDMVVFPQVVIPLFLKGSRVVKLAESLSGGNHLVGLFYQRPRNRLSLWHEDISKVGALARVEKVVSLESGGVKAVAEGLCRVRMVRQKECEPFMMAEVEIIDEDDEPLELIDTLISSVVTMIKMGSGQGKIFGEHFVRRIEKAETPGQLADIIATHLSLKPDAKQSLLEMDDAHFRLRKALMYLHADLQLAKPRPTAATESLEMGAVGRRPKEHDFKNHIRTLQKDFSADDDPAISEIKGFHAKIRNSGMPDDATETATRELQRLERIPPHSPEHIVSRTYIEVLTSLPWNVLSPDDVDISRAEEILNTDHYDLVKVKDRILEFLAVRKLKSDNKGPILCLVGPPGVGKTSLGRSVAKAMGRKFVRMSLGGLHDEAEIRGHRRTYIGAMPGRIISELKRAGSRNPVFMLDEIDKLGRGFKGDPAGALLEVLDPEQNSTFSDHYLDLPFDLSRVMFIATANQVDTIPSALRDRMEIIRIAGYTEEEKEKIAELYLIPKAMKENGLEGYSINFQSSALKFLISSYTKEAGVRNLERELNCVLRKIARELTQGKPVRSVITVSTVEELLGAPKYFSEIADEVDRVGVATGLAWTEAGGDIIFIEVTGFRGRRDLTLTGCLGEVMQESARAALTYLRNISSSLGLDERLLKYSDLHIHVPAGAIPKDGPSAGVAMAVAIASFFTGKPVHKDVAMTGELTLMGRVLPIGGVKEKLLAAKRAGVKKVILPLKNRSTVLEFPEYVTRDLEIHYVSDVGEAIRIALDDDFQFCCAYPTQSQPILPLFHPGNTAEFVS